MGWAARAGVSAGVSTAINGGSFKTAFVNDFVANGAASIANTIGTLAKSDTISEVQRVAAHAVLGCAAQAAIGGQCAGGAIGAMASSIAGNFVDDPKTLFDKALIVGGLSGLGGLAAIAAGKDGISGFNAAKNEVQNNKLLHTNQLKRIETLAGGNPQLKELYIAAGCAIEKCSAEFPTGSDEYRYWKAVEDLGNRPEVAGLKSQLAGQVTPGTLYGTNKVFERTAQDKVEDLGSLAKNTITTGAQNYLSDAKGVANNLAEGVVDLHSLSTRPIDQRGTVDPETATKGGDIVPALGDGLKNFDKIVQSGTSGLGYAMDATLAKDLLVLATKGSGSVLAAIASAGERSGTNSATAVMGSVADANFAQSSIRASELFSKEGVANYSQLAGRPINTVDDLAAAIESGAIKPSQLPVDYVVTTDGTKLILNTRTSVALDRAGVSKSDWYGTNKTGMSVPDMPGKTFDDLAADQIKNNKLPSTGTPTLPKRKN